MLSSMREISAVTAMSLASIGGRLGSSLVIVIGIGGVVAVLTAMLAMAEGFQKTLQNAGRAEHAMVLRDGSNEELSSGLAGEQTDLIRTAPGIAKTAEGVPLVSPEVFVVSDVPKRATGTNANLPVRGITETAPLLRQRFEIIEGRMFEPGRAEMIAGRAAADQFQGLEIGSTLSVRGSDWEVVGIFSTGGDVYESETWVDAPVAQAAFRRGNSFQSVRVKLIDEGALTQFEQAMDEERRLEVDVIPEDEYFAKQSQALSQTIRGFGLIVAVIMAVGAIFGALNTMYSAVSTRNVEIATLRALGFGRLAVVVSVLVESMMLAVIGGVLGACLIYLVLNGYTVSTLNNSTFSQVAFDFAVTPKLMVAGLVVALILGLIGGLMPALRAALVPITTALRQL